MRYLKAATWLSRGRGKCAEELESIPKGDSSKLDCKDLWKSAKDLGFHFEFPQNPLKDSVQESDKRLKIFHLFSIICVLYYLSAEFF